MGTRPPGRGRRRVRGSAHHRPCCRCRVDAARRRNTCRGTRVDAPKSWSGDTVVGHAGQLHPAVIERSGLPKGTCAVELNLDAIPITETLPAPAVSPFPAVFQDVALIVDDDVAAQSVVDAVRDGAGELLEDVRLFDVYTGPQIGDGRKSLALALRFRAADRTLTEDEASAARDAAVATAAAAGRGRTATLTGSADHPPVSIFVTMCSAIASDDVAAGDGALRSNTTRSRMLIRKSSTSPPSASSACARTPATPGTTSSSLELGHIGAGACDELRLLSEPDISLTPVRQCGGRSAKMPACERLRPVGDGDPAPRSNPRGPSASTALGPISTSPSDPRSEMHTEEGVARVGDRVHQTVDEVSALADSARSTRHGTA